MKKFSFLLVMILVLTGCNIALNNTPTKRVEMFLANYQTLNEEVMDDLSDVVMDEDKFNDSQKEKYTSLMKRHYQALNYDIKDEKIDGDEAIVTTQITVYDYTKEKSKANVYKEKHLDEFKTNGKYDESLFNDYLLDKLSRVTDTVTYTINFTLHKGDDGNWKLDALTKEQKQKIHGIYLY